MFVLGTPDGIFYDPDPVLHAFNGRDNAGTMAVAQCQRNPSSMAE
jgi:hypothetical protein